MSKKIRLDQRVVELELATSRTQAQALILAGKILDSRNLLPLTKAGQQVAPDFEVQLKEKLHPWVSRGGMKLAHGLAHFGINPKGQVIADIGASTGGFTDVLLTQGAAKIYAVDVGYGQLAEKLRKDARVVVMEKTNARHLTAEHIAPPLNALVCDASFISLKTVLPAAMALIALPSLRGGNADAAIQSGLLRSARNDDLREGWLLALVKPQFEVGRAEVGDGVITDPALHERVCADITEWMNAQPGWHVVGLTPSPILGPKGNTEFLIYATRSFL